MGHVDHPGDFLLVYSILVQLSDSGNLLIVQLGAVVCLAFQVRAVQQLVLVVLGEGGVPKVLQFVVSFVAVAMGNAMLVGRSLATERKHDNLVDGESLFGATYTQAKDFVAVTVQSRRQLSPLIRRNKLSVWPFLQA